MPPGTQAGSMKTLHLLLGAQSLILVAASLNRLWDATDVAVLPHGALRLVDVLNLLVIAPAAVLVFHALLEHVIADARARWLRLAFIAAVYLFAASYGMHEAADYLNARFCPGQAELCELVGYQDDELSHLLFFAGFTGIAAVLLAAQATVAGPTSRTDRALILANATIVAAAIVANLSFEEIGLDLLAVAAVAVLAITLWLRLGPRPLILYLASSYTVGLVVTAALTMQ
jgi:hypothetical protein